MKKRWFNFEIKVALLVVIIFILVAVTGIWTYQRYSNIVNGITDASRPDMRLVTAHALEKDLIELESHAKTFSLTHDTLYLARFYDASENVEDQLLELETMNMMAENNLDIRQLDTLINKKVNVLKDLLYMQDQFRVQEALSKVVVKIDQKAMKSSNMGASDQDVEESRKKLLDWFKRKKKKEEETAAVTKTQDRESDLIQLETVNKEISKVRNEEVSIENELKNAELELIMVDKELTQKILNLLDEFEETEKEEVLTATRDARYEAEATNVQIAVFCIMAGGLLLLMAVIILQYSQNNHAYQVALKQSQSEAEDLAKTRERFLANMSHEIRTPMNAISGFAEQLSNSPLSDEQTDYVNMIRKSSVHLTHLINDVLDFSKLQGGKLKLEKTTFDLRELVEDVLGFTRQLVGDREVEVRSIVDERIPQLLVGDPYRLRQILLNLLSNSVKFTDHGSVELTVSFEKELEYHKVALQFTVKDTGIGMTAEELDRVFREFEQASASTAKNYGGTGLGLAITRMLAELQGGSIELTSTKGEGTCAQLNLIYGMGNEIAAREVVEAKHELPAKRILVVDDEEYNRKLLRSILSKYGAELMEAENGQVALDLLDEHSFDLILMDARMPVMDGLEAIGHIRLRNLKDVRIIVLTAAVSAEDRKSFELQGADGFVAKPFSTDELMREIARVYSLNPSTNVEQMKEESDKKVSFGHLKALSGDDLAFYTDMLQTFVQSTTGGYALLKVAYDNDDWEMVANEAHKISSPCKHIGANDLYSLLKRIENAARSGEGNRSLKAAMRELDPEVEYVIKEVKRELNSI